MRPNGSESRRGSRRAEREAVFSTRFLDDLRAWVNTDRRTALRVFDLIDAIRRDAFQGIGKPETLRHLGANVWSRRVTQEHRIVYRVGADRIDFLQCRYHY